MNTPEYTSILSEDSLMTAGCDEKGIIKSFFCKPQKAARGLFVLCTKGHCTVTIHLKKFELEERGIAIVMPEEFFQVNEQSADCVLEYITYAKQIIQDTNIFSQTIEYTPYIMERPCIQLNDEMYDFAKTFMEMQRKTIQLGGDYLSIPLVSLSFTQLIFILGNIYRHDVFKDGIRHNRNEEIVKELVRVIILNYTKERNVTFYADALHLSPQHLSTTIKKVTGKTLTEIISRFVIHDAKGKLKSTNMTIQEIAFSLNFSDISFFGKYFKRYTGKSPKQFRLSTKE